jgi:hypothetical protein
MQQQLDRERQQEVVDLEQQWGTTRARTHQAAATAAAAVGAGLWAAAGTRLGAAAASRMCPHGHLYFFIGELAPLLSRLGTRKA